MSEVKEFKSLRGFHRIIPENEINDQEYKKLNFGNEKTLNEQTLYEKNKNKINLFILLFFLFGVAIFIFQSWLSQYTSEIYKNFDTTQLTINNDNFNFFHFLGGKIFWLCFKRFLLLFLINNGNIFACFMFMLIDNICNMIEYLIKFSIDGCYEFMDVSSFICIFFIFYFASYKKQSDDMSEKSSFDFKKSVINGLLIISLLLTGGFIIYQNLLQNYKFDLKFQFLKYFLFSIGFSLFILFFLFDIMELEVNSRGIKSAKQFYFFIKFRNYLKIIFSLSSCFIFTIFIINFYDKDTQGNLYEILYDEFFFIGSYSAFCMEFYYTFLKNYFYFAKYNFNINNNNRDHPSTLQAGNIELDSVYYNTSFIKNMIRLAILILYDYSLNMMNIYYINSNTVLSCLFFLFEGFSIFFLVKQFFRKINLTNETVFENLDLSLLNVASRNKLDNYYLFLEKSSSSEGVENLQKNNFRENFQNPSTRGNTGNNWRPIEEFDIEQGELTEQGNFFLKTNDEIKIVYHNLEDESENEEYII